MPSSAIAAVRSNRPDRPTYRYSAGASTSDSANETPIIAPTIAIAFDRCESRVLSASSAVIAADTAPAPCSARPTVSPSSVWACAATQLPTAISNRPAVMTGLRPNRSEATPNGICSRACVRP